MTQTTPNLVLSLSNFLPCHDIGPISCHIYIQKHEFKTFVDYPFECVDEYNGLYTYRVNLRCILVSKFWTFLNESYSYDIKVVSCTQKGVKSLLTLPHWGVAVCVQVLSLYAYLIMSMHIYPNGIASMGTY